jgi:hypothetical protein
LAVFTSLNVTWYSLTAPGLFFHLPTRTKWSPRCFFGYKVSDGKLQLQQDIVEVVGEGGARQPLHVFEDERARTGLAHGAHRLRKHVALVQEAAVLASRGKGWAGQCLRALLLKEVETLAVTIEI